MHGHKGHRLEGAIAQVGIIQLVGVILPRPGIVRGSVVQAEVEGLPVAGARVQEAQAIVGDHVGDIAWGHVLSSIAEHGRLIVGPAAPGVRVPEGVALLGARRVAQVPFAAEPAAIASLRQDVGIARHPIEIADEPAAAVGRRVT